MSRYAKAAVYDQPRAPFVIRELPLRDVRPTEALVRVTMSSICRSDVHSWQGLRPNPCPGILGHEIIGVIDQLGAEVRCDLRGCPLAEGDRITWTEYFWSDDPYWCDVRSVPQKTPQLGKYGHEAVDTDPHLLGGFAEYCYIVPRSGILKLPESLSDREAVPINCGVSTMISVCENAQLEIGDVVVVQGLGLLGLYACAIARARGARLVIGLDSVAGRVSMARKFGADETVNVTGLAPADLIRLVNSLSGGRGADVVIEVCGSPDVVPTGVKMLRVGGRYVLGGLVNPGSEFQVDGNDLIRKLITLRGVHNYHPRHLVQAVDFVTQQSSVYPFGELVDAVFPLEQINEAFAQAAQRSVLRAAIVPHSVQDHSVQDRSHA